ncbi:MAG: heme peroxidase family protein [Rubrobacteraceae bacterium]
MAKEEYSMPDPRVTSHGGDGPSVSYERLYTLDSKQGDYLRLFPDLRPLAIPRSVLGRLGAPDGPMVDQDEQPGWSGQPQPSDNTAIPAGYTYLGQFIDHDLTLDFTSDPNRLNPIEELPNARTPAFDLDSVYGLGPEASPHLYERGDKLATADRGGVRDLQRREDAGQRFGVALIGDPRNDENQLVSQVHLALMNLHNKLMERVEDFEEARKLTRWHYQWVVLHDFLRKTVGSNLVNDVLSAGPVFFTKKKRHALPVEFTVASYRFGHSQVRPDYVLKEGGTPIAVFAPDDDQEGRDLRGGTKLTEDHKVDWNQFFDFGGGNPQPTRLIDAKLSPALFRMFPGPPGQGSDVPPEERLLAFRNLRRGVAMGLPSGESVAKYMIESLNEHGRPTFNMKVLNDQELGGSEYRSARGPGETPLWYWILAEARTLAEGKTLGPVGGRIIAEVFVGLLENDERSFLSEDPGWEPIEEFKRNGVFDMAALLVASGDASPA